MEHLKKYWWAYGLAVVAIIIIIAMNWKRWFGPTTQTNGTALKCNGTLTPYPQGSQYYGYYWCNTSRPSI